MIITRTSMNGKKYPPLSPVGAMKIARSPGFSDRHDEWERFPSPSLRELSRPKGVTEGVPFDGSTGPTVYPPVIINSEIFDLLRATKYTPSASLRSAAPSVREPGRGCTIQRAARKPQHCGRFSSPLRNSEVGRFHHSSGDTPSVSHSLDSSLREGAGMGCVPFNQPPGKSNVAGDFHRPYETQNI